MEWINSIVQGILLGGFYALLAAGLSFVFGVMRIVNLAHGALVVAGAYLALQLITEFNVPIVAAFPIVALVMAAIGYLLQKGILNRAVQNGGLTPILVTFGLAIIIANLLQVAFSADSRSIVAQDLSSASIKISHGFSIGVLPLITFAAGILVIAALQIFLNRTSAGRAMRATSDDQVTAQLMGINNKSVYAIATAIALLTVGIAGVFLGLRTQFNPNYGGLVLIFAFEAVIIGGLGSLWGTLAGGVILGLAQTLGAQAFPSLGVLIGNIVFLIILAFRPTGLIQKVAQS